MQVFPPRLPYRSFPERVNSVLQAFGVYHVDLTVLGSVRGSGVILFDERQQHGPLVAAFLANLSSSMVTGLLMLINFILNIV